MYAARHSGQKHEMFGYLPGGYARMLAAFRRAAGGTGRRNSHGLPRAKRRRERRGHDRRSTRTDGESAFVRPRRRDDAGAASPRGFARSSRPTKRIVCRSSNTWASSVRSLLLKKPLAGYYVTNITDPAPFTGVIEMTALVDPAEFGGRTLVYLPKYVTADDPAWSQDRRRDSGASSWPHLARLYPQFSADDVLAFRISRVRHVFALSTLDYSQPRAADGDVRARVCSS